MNEILQLKIVLKDTKPPIWRRILVHKNTTFFDLHNIIQIVMGWENYHLYEFNFLNYRISEIDEEFGFDDDIIDSFKITIGEIISKEKQTFQYDYDFGDGWEHKITFEKFLNIEDNKQYPICTAGKLNCPPEDCGGTWGYYELLNILKDKNHPERKERIEWLGEDYNPEHFDIEEINQTLK